MERIAYTGGRSPANTMSQIERFEFESFAIDWVEYEGQWYVPFDQAWKGLGYAQAQNARHHLAPQDYYSPTRETHDIFGGSPKWLTLEGFLWLVTHCTKPIAKELHREANKVYAKVITKGYVDLTGRFDEMLENVNDLTTKVRKLEKENRRLKAASAQEHVWAGATKIIERLCGKSDPHLTAQVFRSIGKAGQQVNLKHHKVTPKLLEQLLHELVDRGEMTPQQMLSAYKRYIDNLAALEGCDDV